MPEQQNDKLTWKQYSNIVTNLATFHQRAIIVPFRKGWGKNSLCRSCACAFILIFLWATFTRDNIMYVWLILWTLSYAQLRGQANKLAGQIHSWYDGDTVGLGSNQKTAKMLYEPVMVAIAGLIAREIYLEYGLPTAGLPTFLLTGCFTLPLVESVKQAIWDRRLDDMNDAKMEQESLVREYRDRYGK
ncbi:MAG TPA: hypothetical protein VH592_08415 [Gemmataceae bacterium]|jgi:hypothetical protein